MVRLGQVGIAEHALQATELVQMEVRPECRVQQRVPLTDGEQSQRPIDHEILDQGFRSFDRDTRELSDVFVDGIREFFHLCAATSSAAWQVGHQGVQRERGVRRIQGILEHVQALEDGVLCRDWQARYQVAGSPSKTSALQVQLNRGILLPAALFDLR